MAREAVHRLDEHGLVLTSRAGNVVLCRFNREHLAADAVRQLVTLRVRLLDRIRAEVAGWPVSPLHAALFGSAARGDGGTASDLDVLVLRPDAITVAGPDIEALLRGMR